MGDKIDILKIVLDFIKGNKLILYVLAAFGIGISGGHYVPPIIEAKPVEVTVATPKNDALKAEIKRLQAEIKILKRWHN